MLQRSTRALLYTTTGSWVQGGTEKELDADKSIYYSVKKISFQAQQIFREEGERRGGPHERAGCRELGVVGDKHFVQIHLAMHHDQIAPGVQGCELISSISTQFLAAGYIFVHETDHLALAVPQRRFIVHNLLHKNAQMFLGAFRF